MARFKIGDRVRVVSSTSGFHGRTGTITGVHRISTDEHADQHDAFELFGYAVELDDGQIEFFTGLNLEAE